DRTRRLHRPHPQPFAGGGAGLLRFARAHGLSHAAPGGRAMSRQSRPLLVELFTEELPPKALNKLGQAFTEALRASLDKQGLLASGCVATAYATPRRLAALFSHALTQAPDQPYAEKLMPVAIGLAADGSATPALQKKLAAKGLQDVDPATLSRESDGKQDYLVARGTAPGAQLAAGLQQALDEAVTGLPIPK